MNGKRLCLSVLMLLSLAIASNNAEAGLPEKRKLKELQEALPAEQTKVDNIVGATIPVEVDWNSFGENSMAINSFGEGFYTSLDEALKEVCKDEMGKTAVKGALKKIVVKHFEDGNKGSAIMKDGTLTVGENFSRGSSITSGQIQSALEAAL